MELHHVCSYNTEFYPWESWLEDLEQTEMDNTKLGVVWVELLSTTYSYQ